MEKIQHYDYITGSGWSDPSACSRNEPGLPSPAVVQNGRAGVGLREKPQQ